MHEDAESIPQKQAIREQLGWWSGFETSVAVFAVEGDLPMNQQDTVKPSPQIEALILDRWKFGKKVIVTWFMKHSRDSSLSIAEAIREP